MTNRHGEDKREFLREQRLRWFGYVKSMYEERALVKVQNLKEVVKKHNGKNFGRLTAS